MKKLFLAMTLILFPFVGFAEKKNPEALQEQIDALRRTMDQQGTNLASALSQVQEMTTEFQRIHGQLDQTLYQAQEQTKKLDDAQRRLEVLENKVALLSTQLEEIKTLGLLPPAQAKALEEYRSFEKALSAVNSEEYKTAIQVLQAFLKANPKSTIADDAQYWIGESYFAMKDYPSAVTELQEVIKKYPKSEKQPLVLYKQGLSFFAIQSYEDSKTFFEKLIKTYPGSDEAMKAKGKINEITKILELKEKEELEKKSGTPS